MTNKTYHFSFKNDEPWELTDERIKLTKQEVKQELQLSLTVDKSQIEDTGVIKFHAKNPAGEDSCVANLNVQSESWQILYKAEKSVFFIFISI